MTNDQYEKAKAIEAQKRVIKEAQRKLSKNPYELQIVGVEGSPLGYRNVVSGNFLKIGRGDNDIVLSDEFRGKLLTAVHAKLVAEYDRILAELEQEFEEL